MCGICGELRFDGVQPGNSTVTAMMARLERRGPDAAGRYADGPVALGHLALASLISPLMSRTRTVTSASDPESCPGTASWQSIRTALA